MKTLVIIIACILTLSPPILQAQVHSIFTGRVADSTGKGVVDVVIVISGTDKQAVSHAPKGVLIVSGITPGLYPFSMRAKDYYEYSDTVSIQNSVRVLEEITLRKLPEPNTDFEMNNETEKISMESLFFRLLQGVLD